MERVEIAPSFPPKSFKANFHFKYILCITGRGFNNLSQVNMARHLPTGQLVAVKQTNLDECTEEELLQLMVGWVYFMRVFSSKLKAFEGVRHAPVSPQSTNSCCPSGFIRV